MATPPEQLPPSVSQARESYARNAWQEAAEALLRAAETSPLLEEDRWRLAWSCGLGGRDSEMLRVLEGIYQLHAEAGKPQSAARAAFWLGFRLLGMGDFSSANGWLARAERMVERAGCECVEQGYLLLPEIRRQFTAGNYALAYDAAVRAERLGERFADADLRVFARNLQGRVLLRQGAFEAGLKLLDEAMLSVTQGELSPSICGLIYCSAIDTCQSAFALDRARQWTAALSRWCDAQPQLITFTGACMVSRAEILQVGGQWSEALAESERAIERYLATLGASATGEARYRQAEIQRLRGELVAAEESYREASRCGRDPQPGLALLRLAQGRADTALHAIRRAAGDVREPFRRAKLLPALIQILLANGAIEEARTASAELDELASGFGSELLQSLALHARGTVELAEGNAADAAVTLRMAFHGLLQVGAPYLAAQARVSLACACQALGDEDGAMLEAQAARVEFQSLGAMFDVAEIERLSRSADATVTLNPGGLTTRELEVLRLVAVGKTNKLIARELCLSEKTVDRHLSNILAKLAVPSRAAATAYAYEHHLL
ncbi:MAG: LuxR C-terminal-related transcriptional regulator [Pseudomonadota bacterium]